MCKPLVKEKTNIITRDNAQNGDKLQGFQSTLGEAIVQNVSASLPLFERKHIFQ